MSVVTMTLGNYSFIPVPLLDINKEYRKHGDGSLLATVYKLSLNGTLVENENQGGLTGIVVKQDAMQLAFSGAAKTPTAFGVACGGLPLITGTPRINSLVFSKSPDNWTMTCPYAAELEWTDYLTFSGADVLEVTDNWSLETSPDRNYYNIAGVVSQGFIANLTRNISAKGLAVTGVPGYISARNFITQYILTDTNAKYQATGMFINYDVLNALPVNHIRSTSYGVYDGTYNLNESWVLLPSGSSKITEDISTTTKTSLDTPLITVSLEGTIQGYETRDYTTQPLSVSQSKFAAAQSYFNSIENIIYSRATGLSSITGLNSIPTATSRGFNPGNGTIVYSYEYNDRPVNVVPHSLVEIYTMGGTNPVDVFASIPVLGRPQGPVLQGLSTKTARTKTVSIDVVTDRTYLNVPNSTGISYYVAQGILIPIELSLSGLYSQVFLTQDDEHWEPKTCRYTRNTSWTVQDCFDTNPAGVTINTPTYFGIAPPTNLILP